MSEPANSLHNAILAAREHNDLTALVNAVPYAKHLGVCMYPVKQDLWFELPYKPALIGNPMLPAIHGGVLAGFMENSAMLHVIVAHQQMRMPKIFDFSLDYLRSAGPETLYARCDVTRQGRRVAHIQVTAWQSDESKPVAVARAHMVME